MSSLEAMICDLPERTIVHLFFSALTLYLCITKNAVITSLFEFFQTGKAETMALYYLHCAIITVQCVSKNTEHLLHLGPNFIKAASVSTILGTSNL